MRYFDHDTSAADDDKIMALRMDCGGAAVDAYWAVLEKIYRDETALVLDENQPGTKALTHRLCIGFEQLAEWCDAMVSVGLLVEPNGLKDGSELAEMAASDARILYSPRAMENIYNYVEKREIARQNGKKGGRKPNANQTQTKSVSKKNQEANQTLTEPLAKEKEKEKEKSKETPPSGGVKKPARFTAPTVEQVRTYALSLGVQDFEAERFCDYYAGQGWKLSNGNPMRDWQATVRNWARRDGQREVSQDAADFSAYATLQSF